MSFWIASERNCIILGGGWYYGLSGAKVARRDERFSFFASFAVGVRLIRRVP